MWICSKQNLFKWIPFVRVVCSEILDILQSKTHRWKRYCPHMIIYFFTARISFFLPPPPLRVCVSAQTLHDVSSTLLKCKIYQKYPTFWLWFGMETSVNVCYRPYLSFKCHPENVYSHCTTVYNVFIWRGKKPFKSKQMEITLLEIQLNSRLSTVSRFNHNLHIPEYIQFPCNGRFSRKQNDKKNVSALIVLSLVGRSHRHFPRWEQEIESKLEYSAYAVIWLLWAIYSVKIWI